MLSWALMTARNTRKFESPHLRVSPAISPILIGPPIVSVDAWPLRSIATNSLIFVICLAAHTAVRLPILSDSRTPTWDLSILCAASIRP